MEPSELVFPIILSLLLICISAFFSAAETAYSSVSKYTIEKQLRSGKKSAKLIKKHYGSFGWTLSTILIGNNIVNVALSSITTATLTSLMGASTLVTVLSTLIVTPIIVVFGEVFPKIFAKKYSYAYLSNIVFIIHFLNILLFPFTFFFSKLTLSAQTNITQKELKELISIAASQKELVDAEAIIASRALELTTKNVGGIMIKRTDVTFVKHTNTVKAAFILFQESGYSRMPVSKDGKYIGVLLLKDIMMVQDSEETVDKFIVLVPKIYKGQKVIRALERMRHMQTHLAFVHSGGTAKKVIGIVTIEDIVEEMIGEIYDEHDRDDDINQIGPNLWIVKGDIKMSELAKELPEFDPKDIGSLTIKQWVQKRMNSKIKLNHKYIYSKSIQFKVIQNINNKDTTFRIKKLLK